MDLAVVSQVVTNIAIIAVGVKLVRHLTQMEFKVSMMWNAFKKKFDIDED